MFDSFRQTWVAIIGRKIVANGPFCHTEFKVWLQGINLKDAFWVNASKIDQSMADHFRIELEEIRKIPTAAMITTDICFFNKRITHEAEIERSFLELYLAEFGRLMNANTFYVL
uniref:Uncharacterized protein n=1 Tax=Rhabditophanes sp. KR3021 TaxID=114890 RepID=A0AC35U8A4_9BILA